MTRKKTVLGYQAKGPRLTVLGAALLALIIALPAGVALMIAELLLF